jgi:hypothetical protein
LPDGIEFTFDRNPDLEYKAELVYSILTQKPQLGSYLHTKISFDSRKNPRIQMADLFARETMKDLDRQIGRARRERRRSMAALLDAGRFHVEVVDRAFCERAKGKIDSLLKDPGNMRERYLDWARQSGDNWGNRLKFLALMEQLPDQKAGSEGS